MTAQPGVVLVKEQKIVHVQSSFPILPTYQNFSIKATVAGQIIFTLPSYPFLTGIFTMNINGITQDMVNGDFSVNGNILTLQSGVNIGDKIAGFYQVLQSINPNAFLNYRTFFVVATQGQKTFSMGFVPSGIIYVAINGVVQTTGDNDYTVNGQYITTSQALNSGDTFFGLAIQ